MKNEYGFVGRLRTIPGVFICAVFLSACGTNVTDSEVKTDQTQDTKKNIDYAIDKKEAASVTVKIPEKTKLGPSFREIDALVSIGPLAVDKEFVFVLLEGGDSDANVAAIEAMTAAIKNVENSGKKAESFLLRKNSNDYSQLATRYPLPCVLAVGKGAGSEVVFGNISETTLVNAFLKAMQPASSDCGTTGAG